MSLRMPACKVHRADQEFCICLISQLFKRVRSSLQFIFSLAPAGELGQAQAAVTVQGYLKNRCSPKTELTATSTTSSFSLGFASHYPCPWNGISHPERATYWSTILEQASPQSQWYSCWITGTFSWMQSTVWAEHRPCQSYRKVSPCH